ncbi:MAG: hypothetical protein AAF599_01595 [Bacteroidota bacterium]
MDNHCIKPCGDECDWKGMGYDTHTINIPFVAGQSVFNLPHSKRLRNANIYGWTIPTPDPAASNNVYISSTLKMANEDAMKAMYLTLKYTDNNGDHHDGVRVDQALRFEDGIFPEPGVKVNLEESQITIHNRNAVVDGEGLSITFFYTPC